MDVKQFNEIKKLLSNINSEEINKKICLNIKKYRLEKYNLFKSIYGNDVLNPYSTQHIA